MRFSSEFLDDIRSRLPISSVVGRKVAWDRRKSNPGKGDFWACCPFHGEKTPSFHVDDRKGLYHCFGCKVSGDVFKFLVEKEGMSFPEAVERLASEAGLPMPRISEADAKREEIRASLYDVMEIAAQFFEAELQAARGAKARGYLADRGLSPAIQKEFRLGYAPESRSALREHLAQRKVTLEQMIEAGLVIAGDDIPVAYDRFRDRVMFPIRDPRGRVIAFGGRALSKDAQAKYLNSPETPLFHKGQVLYNLDHARGPAHEAGSIFVVEGYIDVIAMHSAGFRNVVAPLGTAVTEDQLAILFRTVPEPTICMDGDEAGRRSAGRVADIALRLLKPGCSMKFVLMPEGRDPDDILRIDGALALKKALSNTIPLHELLWGEISGDLDARSPERRSSVEARIVAIVKRISDPTIARHYNAVMKSLFWETISKALGINRYGSQQQSRTLRATRTLTSGIKNTVEWELVGFAALEPNLILEFSDRLGQLELGEKHVNSIRELFLNEVANHASNWEGYELDDLLGLAENAGLGKELQRFVFETLRMLVKSKVEFDSNYIRDSFLEKLNEISHRNFKAENRPRIEVAFKDSSEEEFRGYAQALISKTRSSHVNDESAIATNAKEVAAYWKQTSEATGLNENQKGRGQRKRKAA